MKISDTNFKQYCHPLLVNGERFYLNKDPFQYAEEGVLKYWEEKVEQLAYDLLWQESQEENPEPRTHEQMMFVAARMLAPQFLSDDAFFKYFKQDGGDMIRDTEQLRIHDNDYEGERELA